MCALLRLCVCVYRCVRCVCVLVCVCKIEDPFVLIVSDIEWSTVRHYISGQAQPRAPGSAAGLPEMSARLGCTLSNKMTSTN